MRQETENAQWDSLGDAQGVRFRLDTLCEFLSSFQLVFAAAESIKAAKTTNLHLHAETRILRTENAC